MQEISILSSQNSSSTTMTLLLRCMIGAFELQCTQFCYSVANGQIPVMLINNCTRVWNLPLFLSSPRHVPHLLTFSHSITHLVSMSDPM
ncbi:hypothetical protein Peur_023417 [Populus x canadensis]